MVRDPLTSVVQGGTARRLADGKTLQVYGKTGTGDQRYNVYAKGARLIEPRKVHRCATFVFVIGDRCYGAITAWVHEPYAARYTFTSAMVVQLLKSLAPVLQTLLEDNDAPDGTAQRSRTLAVTPHRADTAVISSDASQAHARSDGCEHQADGDPGYAGVDRAMT